ncbi:MAG TPA: hypothetical protein VNL77_23665 [Roseiflexaceae bacterium]|nr:hypothetical protein [Roseiflexaceae bacterium]
MAPAPTTAYRPLARALLAVAAPLLLGGIWAGLLRLGWGLPPLQPQLAHAHGPLFVSGVLGTVIGLERAVALGRRWAFAGPALSGLGGLALLAGLPAALGAGLMALGSLALLAVFGAIIRRQPARFTVTMALGALAWLGGNLLWLAGRPFALVALWWAGFLVLTIAGERLELGRLRQLPPHALWIFTFAVGALLAGLATAAVTFDAGARLAGASLAALALWMLRYDIARRTVRKPGLPRFSAICILSGSAWLALGGALYTVAGALYAGPLYDAMLHAVFVGFVFAMIFGHAPIVFPAVIGVPVAFLRAAYLPLAVLHLSLALRLAGDLAGLGEVRRWGGLLNGAAILLFAAVTLLAARRARSRAAPPQAAPPAGVPR